MKCAQSHSGRNSHSGLCSWSQTAGSLHCATYVGQVPLQWGRGKKTSSQALFVCQAQGCAAHIESHLPPPDIRTASSILHTPRPRLRRATCFTSVTQPSVRTYQEPK